MNKEKAYERYCTLRDKAGITDYQVAKDTGLNAVMFYQWKNGEYCPKVDKIIKLADYFGVDLEYFLRRINGKQHSDF